jgi:RNA polymerase sigma-70 factor, ECF subfamily
VSNACLDELRRRARRPVPGDDALATFDGVPDAGVDAVAGRLDADGALARLPYEFRVAVVLRDLCDLDYAEIASLLDLPPGTVRSRIARGRAQLAALLQSRNQPTDPGRQTPRTDTEARP